MSNETCPCCHNHCDKDNLGCGRGMDYFRNEGKSVEDKTITEQVVNDLRRCGHMLHHNRELSADSILANFSEEELDELHKLLSKIE